MLSPNQPSGADTPRPALIPPHIAWPLFVVALLLMSITAATITVIAANSDGGVQVIETSPYGENATR